MRFDELLYQMMDCRGVSAYDFEKLLRDNKYITDEILFAITRYINTEKPRVFFNRKIGDLEVKMRFFEIAIDYQIYRSDGTLGSAVCLNLDRLTLHVEFPDLDEKIIIRNDLMDIDSKYKTDKVWRLRIQVLNEILTRYYSKILYLIYLDRSKWR